MALVLGSPVPRELGNSAPVVAFPQTGNQWTDPTGAIVVPAGWGTRSWFAFRATLGAAARGEFIVIGDSTSYGSGGDYAWCQRIRDDATGDATGGPAGFGMTDGGKGMFAQGEAIILYDSPEINGFSAASASGFGTGADIGDNTDGQYYYSPGTSPGDTLTLVFRSTACRLWYSTRATAGQFTYTVDGGAPVTVTAYSGAGGTNAFVYLSGLSAGTTHTLVITNLGGLPCVAPGFVVGTDHVTGTLPPSTLYTYAVTCVTAAGETTPATQAVTTSGFSGNENTVLITNPHGTPGASITAYRIYRQTGGTGSFLKFGADITPGSGSFTTVVDNGSTTPSGASPPGSNTAGLNTGSPACYIALAPVNAVGFSVQKYATNGDTINTRYFGSLATSPFTQTLSGLYQTTLGLLRTAVASPNYTGAARDTTHDSDGGRVRPVLAVSHLGFNDLGGSMSSANLNAMAVESIKRFAGACTDANCDGMILSGQLPYNTNWYTKGQSMFSAMKAQAAASGLGFVDLFYPVGGPSLSYAGGVSSPHLTKAQYQSQADFLWNGIMGLT